VASIRHLAIAASDPEATAQFYIDAFGLRRVRELSAGWGHGYVLTDGVISLSVIRYTDDGAAGAERGAGFVGLHHIGVEVEDLAGYAERVEAAGGRARADISDALGIPPAGRVKEYEGPDGVLLDLGRTGVWTRDTET
jgi:methylmalonyl-CoA/ethylmalonyl-CoA epimerase